MLIKFNKDKDSDDANDEVKDKDNDEVNVKMHWRKGEIGGGWSRPHGPNTFPHAIGWQPSQPRPPFLPSTSSFPSTSACLTILSLKKCIS